MIPDICQGLRPVSPHTKTRVSQKIALSPGLSVLGLGGGAIRVLSTDKRAVDLLVRGLKTGPHEALLSADGCKAMLILSKDTSDRGTCFRCLLLNAARQVMNVRVAFDAALFHGDTIFSGELIRGANGVRVFLVQDLLVLQGACLAGRVAPCVRLEWARDTLQRGHTPDPAFDDLHLLVKRNCSARDVGPLLGSVPQLSYHCTSLVLRPADHDGQSFLVPLRHPSRADTPTRAPQGLLEPVLGTDPAQQGGAPVAKPPHDPHRELKMEVRRTELPDVYEVRPHNRTDGWESLCVATLSASRHMKDEFRNVPRDRTLRIMCAFNVLFGRWGPIIPASSATTLPGEDLNSFPSTREAAVHLTEDGC